MRNEVARKIVSEAAPEQRRFIRKYAEIVTRVHQLLQDRNESPSSLAGRMGKSPSEISKWLSGEHNLTLRSLMKLEEELQADIINIPKKSEYITDQGVTVNFTVMRNDPPTVEKLDESFEYSTAKTTHVASAI